MPQDVRAPYDVHEVIGRLVDGSELHEFKPLYGTTLVCGFARIWGMPVAILANNGVLFSESALEGRALHRARLPAPRAAMLFLQNISGFMVGGQIRGGRHRQERRQAGHRGRHRQSVPKITVLIGGSFGAGNYGMCGRAVRAALPVHLAQCADQRDGRRAGGVGARHRPPRRRPLDAGGGGRVQGADPARSTRTRAIPITPPRGCGTTASSTPSQTRDVLGLAFAATLNAPIPERAQFGLFRM